ncbi:MAG: protein kinase [Deltaproteobacteria bacterium]|jgi:serine/threonine protein kinase|nr:protein kinase [Deltaproteobacteria bacterium]
MAAPPDDSNLRKNSPTALERPSGAGRPSRQSAKTIKDPKDLKESSTQVNPKSGTLSSFRGRQIQSFLSSSGSEADILILKDQTGFSVLRLYRQGRAPKSEIFQRLVKMSNDMNGLAVRVLETGYDDGLGRWFEIQEYLAGGDLASLLSRGPLDHESLVSLVTELSEALVRLHGQDIIHRDIKPENILIRSFTPLKIALSDFGISSLLAPDISIKETRMANTPLYSAPESFGSIVGKAADWWSLGAVILEAALGYHPLAKLSFNEVLREITTRGLKVPDNLPQDESLLLKGLLTRDDRKRWRYHEVLGWLMGQRDIPIHYEVAEPAPEETPFLLDGQEFHAPGELAIYFASSEETWEKGRESLARGYIRQWLEKREMFDEAIQCQGGTSSPDAAVFNFVLSFAPHLGLIYRGQILSAKNIAQNVANKAHLSLGAQNTLKELIEGRLAPLVSLAQAHKQPFDELTAALLTIGQPIKDATLVAALAAAKDPDAYIWGQNGSPTRPGEAIRFVVAAGGPLVDLAYWEANVPAKSILPKDIFQNGLNQAITYRQGANRLFRLVQEGYFGQNFLRRGTPLENAAFDNLRASPLTTDEAIQYLHWLKMDAEAQTLEGFNHLRNIDALERKKRFSLFRKGPKKPKGSSFSFGGLTIFLILAIIPLIWALDGLDIFRLESWRILPGPISQYRGVQGHIYKIAGAALILTTLFWFVRKGYTIVAIILGAAAGYAVYRHRVSLEPYLPYLKWVVHGGFFLLCLSLANWARKLAQGDR